MKVYGGINEGIVEGGRNWEGTLWFGHARGDYLWGYGNLTT